MYPQSLFCVALASVVLAGPLNARKEYAVRDSHIVPPGWKRIDRVPSDHYINLHIGLRQSGFDELERTLYQVSDPAHDRYGQHLTAADVTDLIKPSYETLDAVHDWLADHDVDPLELDYSPAKDWISVVLPVAKVEQLLDTEYHQYTHEDGESLMRALRWSLPQYLHDHVTTIQPTNSFFRPMARSRGLRRLETFPMQPHAQKHTGSSITEVCNSTLVTPLCLRTFYGTLNYTVQAAGKNYMAITDYLGEINNRSDVETFLETYRPHAVSAAYEFSQISIAKGTVQQTQETEAQLDNGIGVEGNLDVQSILGIAWPIPLVAYSTGGLNPDFKADANTPTDSDEPYLVWLKYILSLPDDALPSVISTSYGDDEQTVSYAYASQTCNMFAQLGARGVTVLFASGDYGVGATGTCYKNDGSNATTFLPGFPNDCPYVTNVGATKDFAPEVAAYDGQYSVPFTSGAGFSNYFARPSYQDKAVSHYLSTYVKDQHDGLYNKTGRAFPDIAFQGQAYAVVWNGTVGPVDGTSAATPGMAGVVALINDALIAAGKSPIGFMNPWLYSTGYKAFNDITKGSSAGCNTTGFNAEPGWDAVTGWGTPSFPRILKALGLDFKI